MKIRPVHTWCIGVGLFAPSILTWIVSTWLFVYNGMFDCPGDWQGITRLYLPMFAAAVGFVTPLICLRCLRSSSWRVTGWAFACYLAVMLTWGGIDIRHRNYQMGGHDYPDGVVEGYPRYWHAYYTWYFLPYRWIER